MAARGEFAANGFAATRLDDVARRAAVGKGTIYLYFKNKEELFEGVIRRWVVPKFERMRALQDEFDGPSEQIIGQILELVYREVAGTDLRQILRMIVAEGERFPHLVEFYYHEVVERGIHTIGRVLERGVARGEFRPTELARYPQAIVGPIMVAGLWKVIFEPVHPLDLEALCRVHLDLILHGIRRRRTEEALHIDEPPPAGGPPS